MQIPVTFFRTLDANVSKASPSALSELPEHELVDDKGDVYLWAPIKMEAGGHRAAANIPTIHAFVIDLDEVSQDEVDDTIAKLASDGLEFWAHTSFSHDPETQPKWRIVVPYRSGCPNNKHKRVWRALRDKYAPGMDRKCCDISRAYYLPSCPPECAEDAVSFQAPGDPLDWTQLQLADEPEAGRPLSKNGRSLDDDQYWGLVAAIVDGFPERGERHELALALGGALRRELICDQHIHDAVQTAFHAGGSDQPEKHAETAIHSATTAASGDPTYGWTTVASIIGKDAVKECRRHAEALRAGIDITLPDKPSPENMHSAWPDANSSSLTPLHCNSRGTPHNTSANVERILSGHPAWAGVLAFDELAGAACALRPPPTRPGAWAPAGQWTDEHTTAAQHWIADTFGFEPARKSLEAALMSAAMRKAINPVREYLETLKWDGTPRLPGLLARYFGAVDNQYTRAVGQKFMVSCAARAMDPGCKVDTMLILEGPQGARKSTACDILARGFFSDSGIDFNSKDGYQTIQGKWIVEIPELDSFSRTDVRIIKRFLSSKSDRYRSSYGRFAKDNPRRCVFIGTTNESEYLTDPTGARRFWPVEVGQIDFVSLTEDVDQLWAEAVHYYRVWAHETKDKINKDHKFQWWLSRDEVHYAASQQERRRVIDPWEEALADWIQREKPTDFSVTDALGALELDPSQQHSGTGQRVGHLLRRLGFVSRRKRKKGRLVRVYEHANQSQQLGGISSLPAEMGDAEAGAAATEGDAGAEAREGRPRHPGKVERPRPGAGRNPRHQTGGHGPKRPALRSVRAHE